MRGRRRAPCDEVSPLTVSRLSIYLRCLRELERRGVSKVSSGQLASIFNLNSAQIRKDLAYFGEFGVRGVGYNVSELRSHLEKILGLDRERRLVVAGAGHLGMALCHRSAFAAWPFLIVGVLDSDPEKIGKPTPAGILVEDVARMKEIVAQRQVSIGVIATPAEAAQEVCDQMVDAGLMAICNFAPVHVKAPDSVKVETVELRIYLEGLSFYLSRMEGQ